MTSNQGKNTAASIRDRLLKLSRRRGEDFQLILTRYGMERLLYRLSRSESKTTSSNILEIAAAAYEEDGKKDDSLIEVLRDLSDFDLLWRHGSETPPMERVSNRTMLIDVHAMPVLKELVAYLVIERLYKARFSAPGYYRIEVQGQLGPYWPDRFGGMRVLRSSSDEGNAVTVMEGRVSDQAKLAGILNTLYELHLPLLSVQYLDEAGYE